MIKHLMQTNLIRMMLFFIFTLVTFSVALKAQEAPILLNVFKSFKIITGDKLSMDDVRILIILIYSLLTIAFILKTIFIDIKHLKKQRTLFVDKNGYIFISLTIITIIICLFDTVFASMVAAFFYYPILMKSYVDHSVATGQMDYREDMRNCCGLKEKILYEPIDKVEAYSYVSNEKIIIHENCIVFRNKQIKIDDILKIKSMFSKNIYELNDDEMKVVDMMMI